MKLADDFYPAVYIIKLFSTVTITCYCCRQGDWKNISCNTCLLFNSWKPLQNILGYNDLSSLWNFTQHFLQISLHYNSMILSNPVFFPLHVAWLILDTASDEL